MQLSNETKQQKKISHQIKKNEYLLINYNKTTQIECIIV